MTRPEAKNEELSYVRQMISLVPRLGVIGDPAPRESPDFVVSLIESRTAGIEVVRAVDQGIAAGRGAKAKMKKRVEEGMRAAGVSAHVNFSISDGAAGALAAKNMKSQLSDEVTALVGLSCSVMAGWIEDGRPWRHYRRFDDIVDEHGNVCWRDPDRARGSYDLDGSGIAFCTAVMVRPHTVALATASGTSRGQPASIIQTAIDEKAKLLSEYRKSGCDEQWLLVVGSATEGGTLDISDADGEFSSPFDRTFFLERFEGKCVELKIRR